MLERLYHGLTPDDLEKRPQMTVKTLMLIAYWYITPVFAGMFFYENKSINTFIHSGPPKR
jgi:hypothetical protein